MTSSVDKKPSSSTAWLVAKTIAEPWMFGEPYKSAIHFIIPNGYGLTTKQIIDASGVNENSLIRRLISRICEAIACICLWTAMRIFPGYEAIIMSIALRKRFFHDRIVQAINEGANQVLVLGGGYDVLVTVLAPQYP